MEWIETATGNRISKKAQITGSNRILISGYCTIHEQALLQGELTTQEQKTAIQLGKYCYLGRNSQIIPPEIVVDGNVRRHETIRLGSFITILENTIIRLASIGNRVLIEADCLLEDSTVIYDCCLIVQGCRIPPHTVIPPFSKVSGGGSTPLEVSDLNGSYRKLIESEARERYVQG